MRFEYVTCMDGHNCSVPVMQTEGQLKVWNGSTLYDKLENKSRSVEGVLRIYTSQPILWYSS